VFLAVNLAQMILAVQQALVKHLMIEKGVDPVELSFWRGFISLWPNMLMVWVHNRSYCSEIRRNQLPTFIVRIIVGVVSFYLISIAIKNLPLSIFTIVRSTAPFGVGVL